MFKDLCKQIGFEPVFLQANDKQGTDKIMKKAAAMSYMFFSQGRPIYHTNVFMSIMTRLAVICIEAIQGDKARADLQVSKIRLS